MSPMMLDEKRSGENAEKQASSYVVGGLRFGTINRTLKCYHLPPDSTISQYLLYRNTQVHNEMNIKIFSAAPPPTTRWKGPVV